MTLIAAVVYRGGMAAALAAIAGACGNGNRAAADTVLADTERAAPATPEPRPAPESPADSVAPLLETGCGGGFTGGGGGTFVTAGGRFYRFQQSGPSPNAKRELTFVRADSARGAALVQAAERAGITRVTYSVPANMTCYLSLARGGTSYEVAWGMGTKPAPVAQLVAVAADLEAAAR